LLPACVPVPSAPSACEGRLLPMLIALPSMLYPVWIVFSRAVLALSAPCAGDTELTRQRRRHHLRRVDTHRRELGHLVVALRLDLRLVVGQRLSRSSSLLLRRRVRLRFLDVLVLQRQDRVRVARAV